MGICRRLEVLRLIYLRQRFAELKRSVLPVAINLKMAPRAATTSKRKVSQQLEQQSIIRISLHMLMLFFCCKTEVYLNHLF